MYIMKKGDVGMTIKNKFKENKKFRNTVISVVSVTLTVAIILSSTLIITKVKKNKVAVGSSTENISDDTNAQIENESTAANSADESTSQFDEQNNKTKSSEPVSRSGNTQTESGSQAQKPNNVGSNNGTTTTTKHNGGNTVTTTKAHGGSATNQCNHSWSEWRYANNNTTKYRMCNKCGFYEEDSSYTYNPRDWLGTQSEYLEFMGYVNAERRKRGIPEVKYYYAAQEGANIRACELHTNFSHTRPNGQSCLTAVSPYITQPNDGTAIAACCENIVSGTSTAKNAYDAWYNSKGHRENMLREATNYIVVARSDNDWVMIGFNVFEI